MYDMYPYNQTELTNNNQEDEVTKADLVMGITASKAEMARWDHQDVDETLIGAEETRQNVQLERAVVENEPSQWLGAVAASSRWNQ